MADWGASPYRAIGIYIGGTNMACSQPNLSATWVSQESAAGWHMIPIYVGLQSPSNSCGCAGDHPGHGRRPGHRGRRRTPSSTPRRSGWARATRSTSTWRPTTGRPPTRPPVLAFLAAWTTQLHASGYLSGVYSSDASGIADLVAQYGHRLRRARRAVDRQLERPADHRRRRRPRAVTGPRTSGCTSTRARHNETYGGAKINIDGDYLDAATAAAGTGSGVDAAPAVAADAVAAGHRRPRRDHRASRRPGPAPPASRPGR